MSAKPVRLDKLLSNLGYGARREIAALAKSGAIVLHGTAITDPSTKIHTSHETQTGLKIYDDLVDPFTPFTLMLHKPIGTTCSTKDPGQRVLDLLPERWRRRSPALSPVGRLDKDTSGLLLLTDDGQLNHRITSPKTETPKRYHVTLEKNLTGGEGPQFASGLMILEREVKPLKPAELEVLGEREAILTLHEGRYHQVRRMFAAVGNHVTALHRRSIGGLGLPEGLAPGQWRELNQSDVETIFEGQASNSVKSNRTS